MMLQRNLLYTAVTRGKKLVVLVGTKKALGMAVRRQDTARRYTALRKRLQEATLLDAIAAVWLNGLSQLHSKMEGFSVRDRLAMAAVLAALMLPVAALAAQAGLDGPMKPHTVIVSPNGDDFAAGTLASPGTPSAMRPNRPARER